MASILTIANGQSNMSPALQGALAKNYDRYGYTCAGYLGGNLMSAWVAGTSPSYTRGAQYTAMIANCLTLKPSKIVLIFMQGESDADAGGVDTTALLWRGKFEAMVAFLEADFPGADVYTVVCKPYPASNALPMNAGYTALRAGIDAYAAANPGTSVAIETSDLTRPAADVHLSTWETDGEDCGALQLAERIRVLADHFYRN